MDIDIEGEGEFKWSTRQYTSESGHQPVQSGFVSYDFRLCMRFVVGE